MRPWLIAKIFFERSFFRAKVALDSLCPLPAGTGKIYERYIRAYYPLLAKDLEQFNRPGLKVIEFGGSNKILTNFLPEVTYEIAPNYPEVDIQNLRTYPENGYDLVLLDQILEHVENPFRAVEEIRRILKPGGSMIAAVPFLVYIHPTPDDFWRFTESGIRKLCENFSQVDVRAWGNRVAMQIINKYGFDITMRQAKALLGFSYRNEKNFPIIYWFLAQK